MRLQILRSCHFAFLAVSLALASCGSKSTGLDDDIRLVDRPTVLNQTLSKPVFQQGAQLAEKDLPNDEWVNKPFRFNQSRFRREYDVASKVIEEIKPRLKSLSVTELIHSLQLVPSSFAGGFSGVAYYVFRDGNKLIIEELKSRPLEERRKFQVLSDHHYVVWDGDNGGWPSLEWVIESIINFEG